MAASSSVNDGYTMFAAVSIIKREKRSFRSGFLGCAWQRFGIARYPRCHNWVCPRGSGLTLRNEHVHWLPTNPP